MSTLKTVAVASCVVLVFILVVAESSSAEIPKKINYQGRLTDSATGSPLVGPHNMTFRIYDDLDAGSLLWSESSRSGIWAYTIEGLGGLAGESMRPRPRRGRIPCRTWRTEESRNDNAGSAWLEP